MHKLLMKSSLFWSTICWPLEIFLFQFWLNVRCLPHAGVGDCCRMATNHNYSPGCGVCLGVFHIIFGLGSCGCGIAAIILQAYSANIAVGIWAGIVVSVQSSEQYILGGLDGCLSWAGCVAISFFFSFFFEKWKIECFYHVDSKSDAGRDDKLITFFVGLYSRPGASQPNFDWSTCLKYVPLCYCIGMGNTFN